jgi:hypothetical protein
VSSYHKSCFKAPKEHQTIAFAKQILLDTFAQLFEDRKTLSKINPKP